MIYDTIVVGGGHAGIEAALAVARMQKKSMLITGDFSKVASLPCNPSLGGPAKGVVVREIDALGGEMGKSADKGQIQMKMLNTSKGPAVYALRAQLDKKRYPEIMLEVLKTTKNLTLLEDFVEKLIIEDNQVKGVCLENGNKIYSKTVIITTGTYLNSSILIGHEVVKSGPQGEKTTYGISEQLKELGFEIIRLKTGTPPRIKKDSVDLSQMVIQKGDDKKQTFSFNNKYNEEATSHPCYLVHTTDETKRLILENLDSSAMYGGIVEGIGPRYCPSIEDKIVRFPKNERHQIFLEPESLEIDEWYLQGLSTSLPRDVQEKLVHSIKGMENAIINKYAYAIEYDAINPMQLKFNLETKKVKNLFCAGQINGTSGYEEAAAQGIMAGINAVLLIDNKKPFVLKRNEAYIGVMIDDLITKGVDEPYRLLTSRAEHRLSIRHDNADIRLRKYGYELGLVSKDEYNMYLEKLKQINNLKLEIEEINIFPTKENNNFLNKHNSASLYEKISIKNLLKRPEIKMDTIKSFLSKQYDDEVMEQVEIQTKYEGYILKDQRNIDKMLNLESKIIPKNINYNNIKHLSTEAKEKLVKVLPETIGQASRILGVNPPDISNLLIYIKQEYNK